MAYSPLGLQYSVILCGEGVLKLLHKEVEKDQALPMRLTAGSFHHHTWHTPSFEGCVPIWSRLSTDKCTQTCLLFSISYISASGFLEI